MIPLKDVIPSRTWPVVTMTVLALNAAVFLFQLSLGADGSATFIVRHGLIPAEADANDALTSIFIHGGFLHVGANLLYLWIFGENVEDRL